MKYKSYRKKLITIFILISVIPVVFVIFITNLNLKSEIINEKIKYISHDISSKAEKLDFIVFDKNNILDLIVQNHNLIDKNLNNEMERQKINNYLYTQAKSFDYIENLFITTEEGYTYNSKSLQTIADGRERPWYIGAKEEMGLFWTTPYKGLLSNKTVVTLSKPIINKDNKLEGVIGIDIDFDNIHEKLKEIKINDVSSTYLLDEDGNKVDIIGNDIIESFQNIKYKDILENDETTYKMYNDYFLVYTTIDSSNWKIVSIVKRNELISDLMNVNKYIIYIIIITTLAVVALAIKYGKQFSEPLEILKEGTNQIQKGNYNFRINMNNDDEFDDVAHAFNDMTSNLKAYYEGLTNRSNELEEMNIELEASYEQLEATLRQLNDSEDKYRMLVENMYDIVWIVDADLNVAFVNDAINRILKLDKENLIGKNIRNLSDIWKDRKSFRNIVSKAKEDDFTNWLSTLIDSEGNEKIVEVSTKRIIENGNIIGIQGIMRDVTQSKLMQREILRKNEELTVINKVSENLNSNLNLDWLLNRVTKDLTKLLDISLCSIRIVNDNGNLELKAVEGELKNHISKEDIVIECECIDDLLDGEQFNVRGIPEICYENYNEEVSKIFEQNYSSVIPIKSKHNISGLIIVSSESDIKESEINIIKSVVNQTAMVIDNIKLYNDLKKRYLQIIEGLVTALDAKDSYTEGHSYRVSRYSHLIAQKLGLSNEECEEIKISGILHDIGKIGINDGILSKPGKLTDEEYNAITTHPMIGSKILEKVGVSDSILNGVRYHHKRFDLKGYPKEIELKSLPIEASIIGVADAFDAMTSNRSYRNSLGFNTALDEIIKYRGTQFEPKIVDIMVDLIKNEEDKIIDIAKSKKA